MKKCEVKVVRLGDLGVLRQGTRHYAIRNSAGLSDAIEVKIQKWTNLKTEELNEQDIIIIDRKHYNEEVCIIEGDIALTTFPTIDSQNIVYMDKTLGEEYLYGETVYIYRTNSDVDSEYIFSILDSGLYNKYIEKLNVGYKLKLKQNMILDMKIPIIDTATQQTIIKEHKLMMQEQRKIKDLEKELNNRKEKINKELLKQIESFNRFLK